MTIRYLVKKYQFPRMGTMPQTGRFENVFSVPVGESVLHCDVEEQRITVYCRVFDIPDAPDEQQRAAKPRSFHLAVDGDVVPAPMESRHWGSVRYGYSVVHIFELNPTYPG